MGALIYEATVSTTSLRPLKPKQLEALQSFEDMLVALPIGYGKFVIFAGMTFNYIIM